MERLLPLVVVVIGVPLALFAYITLAEMGLGRLPDRWRPRLRPWIWIGPALFFVSAYLVYPSLQTIRLSLMDARSQNFVGLDNYLWMVGSEAVHIALRNNVLWVVLFTGMVVVFGLLFAVLADRVRYESLAKSVIFLPMAVSFVAAGVIWRFVFEFQPPGVTQTGLLNAAWTGVGGEPTAWLINAPLNNLFLIAAGVWVWTGFAMVILSAALKGIPVELLEAARVDGASELYVFRRIILPLMGPTIAVITTTMVIFALKAFDIVYVMTSGNFGTDVIALRMYTEMFTNSNFGRSAAVAILLLAAIIPVLAMNIRRFHFQEQIR